MGWRHALALHTSQVSLKRALDAAVQEWQNDPSEEAWGRVAAIQDRLARALPSEAHE
jgi:hypothetical protein